MTTLPVARGGSGWALAGDTHLIPSAVSPRQPSPNTKAMLVTGPQLGAWVCGMRGSSPHCLCPTLSPGEGLLEPGGPHSGPTLPVCGDSRHGGGHSLDLPAGRLQPAPTPAFPWGPLLLPGAGQALHLEWACPAWPGAAPRAASVGLLAEGDRLWGWQEAVWTGVPEKGQALPREAAPGPEA